MNAMLVPMAATHAQKRSIAAEPHRNHKTCSRHFPISRFWSLMIQFRNAVRRWGELPRRPSKSAPTFSEIGGAIYSRGTVQKLPGAIRMANIEISPRSICADWARSMLYNFAAGPRCRRRPFSF
jgi:hypothetical protein